MGAIRKTICKGLFAFFTLSAAISAPAMAEDHAITQAYVHTFNNNVTVYSGVFALNRDLDLDTSLYAKYTVDLINPSFGGEGGGDDHSLSKGSVNVMSGASAAATSSGNSSDTRHDFNAGFTRNLGGGFGAEAYIDYSFEKDYVSRTPTVTLKKDLFDKNTTITLGYSRNMDTIKGQFLDASESRNTNNYFIGLTQILSPYTVAQIGYSRSESQGLESEGIRLVPVGGATQSSCTAKSSSCLNEVFPRYRNRNAYIAGINHYLSGGMLDRSAIKLTFRYYDDDWDVSSYMAEAEWYKYLDEDFILRLNYRYYDQTKAFFVKSSYAGTEEFLSVSPQLEEFNTHLAGIKGIYSLGERGRGDGFMASSLEGKYEYYRESTGVVAHILMAGLRFLY